MNPRVSVADILKLILDDAIDIAAKKAHQRVTYTSDTCEISEQDLVFALKILIITKFGCDGLNKIDRFVNGTDDIDIEWALWEPAEIALLLKSEINNL